MPQFAVRARASRTRANSRFAPTIVGIGESVWPNAHHRREPHRKNLLEAFALDRVAFGAWDTSEFSLGLLEYAWRYWWLGLWYHCRARQLRMRRARRRSITSTREIRIPIHPLPGRTESSGR